MRIPGIFSSIVVLLLTFHYNLSGQQKELFKTFPLTTPELQGISAAVLDSMMLFIKNTNQNVHHITLVRNNRTILDADIYPYSPEYLHDLASVTKSFTALLTGIAIDKKFIRDENERVLKYFPEIKNDRQFLDSLKIKNLLTMTSGFACGVSGGEKALSDMRKSRDWIKFIFDLPMIAKPGEVFSYCSCNFYLLAEIIYRATKMTPLEFARKYLFAPVGIRHSKWITNYKRINHGWGDLFLLPADMAKIGKLIVDKGKWKNEQLISADWVNKSLHTFSNLPDNKGYGYGWWTNNKAGYYEAAGRGRQTISVIPSKNMVVTMLGGEFDAGAIGRYIFDAIKSDKPLPANVNDNTALNDIARQLSRAPVPKTAPINKTIIQKLDKRMIVFEKNITGIDSLRFDFGVKKQARVTFYKNQTPEQHPFKLSTNTYALSLDAAFNLPVALQARCDSADRFVLHYNQLCRINNFFFYFTVTGDSVTTTIEETSNFITLRIASSFR